MPRSHEFTSSASLQWRPFMQARYIAARVAEGRSLQEVADLIGIPKSKAADLYRDQAVLTQAANLGLETSQVESAFSLLTVAMGSTKIRSHVGAPLGSQTVIGQDPVPADRVDEPQGGHPVGLRRRGARVLDLGLAADVTGRATSSPLTSG